MINNSIYQRVYNGIEKYLASKSRFSPNVMNMAKGDDFPKVVVEPISNISVSRDSNGFISHSLVGIEVNVYAQTKTYDEVYSGMEIANEIASHCSYVCEEVYGMKRSLCTPTPDIDPDVYRITLRYTALQDDIKSVFY